MNTPCKGVTAKAGTPRKHHQYEGEFCVHCGTRKPVNRKLPRFHRRMDMMPPVKMGFGK